MAMNPVKANGKAGSRGCCGKVVAVRKSMDVATH